MSHILTFFVKTAHVSKSHLSFFPPAVQYDYSWNKKYKMTCLFIWQDNFTLITSTYISNLGPLYHHIFFSIFWPPFLTKWKCHKQPFFPMLLSAWRGYVLNLEQKSWFFFQECCKAECAAKCAQAVGSSLFFGHIFSFLFFLFFFKFISRLPSLKWVMCDGCNHPSPILTPIL